MYFQRFSKQVYINQNIYLNKSNKNQPSILNYIQMQVKNNFFDKQLKKTKTMRKQKYVV